MGTNDGTLTAIAPVDPDMVGLSFNPTNDTLYGVEWNDFAGLDHLDRIGFTITGLDCATPSTVDRPGSPRPAR